MNALRNRLARVEQRSAPDLGRLILVGGKNLSAADEARILADSGIVAGPLDLVICDPDIPAASVDSMPVRMPFEDALAELDK